MPVPPNEPQKAEPTVDATHPSAPAPTPVEEAQKTEPAVEQPNTDAPTDIQINHPIESDSKEKSVGNDNPSKSMYDRQKELIHFGYSGDKPKKFSEDKWAVLEPTLPVSILKVSPKDKLDVVEKLESMFNFVCSYEDNTTVTADDGTSVELIFCSKKDRRRTHTEKVTGPLVNGKFVDVEETREVPYGFFLENDETVPICQRQFADFAYLALKSPKDHNTRVYPIDANINLGYAFGSCVDMDEENELSLIDAESTPFMDTTGIYVRTQWTASKSTEHWEDSTDDKGVTCTVFLFAGDKHRLVGSWNESCNENK